jgi:hypothetical protein
MACANDLQVSEEDFCEGGALAHLQMELQLWAAYRGQLLSRTVRGALAVWNRLEAGCVLCSPSFCETSAPGAQRGRPAGVQGAAPSSHTGTASQRLLQCEDHQEQLLKVTSGVKPFVWIHVAGMMSYADGLKLLAEVENPRPADMPEGDYQLWLADLIESKYTYVVASQVRSSLGS